MELITPPFLKKGDTAGIVAPARRVTPDELAPAIGLLQKWGLNVATGKNIYNHHHQFSGTDAQRASDLQDMIADPNISAILCARGGYGTIRLLNLINLRDIQRSPKWIVGYSDITVLHGLLNSWYGLESIHGTMPFTFPADGKENESSESLRRVLFGQSPTYEIPHHPLNRQGKASGILRGGNLSILHSLCGTIADITTTDTILFIEDLDEYLYHIDRMMMTLKHSGKLDNISGLVVGSMMDIHDNETPFGMNALEIIRNAADEFTFPICFGFPAGHDKHNMALIMGRKVTLTINGEGTILTFDSRP